jgi:hypothetical protein
MRIHCTALTQRLRALVTKSFAQTRQAPRLAFTASIEVRTATGAVFRGIARDLSRLGLGAIVCADLQVGESVLIKYVRACARAIRQPLRFRV